MWLVRYASDRAVQQLDEFDTHALGKLGFWSEAACASEISDGASDRVRPCSFVHCYCEKGALLSKPFRRDLPLNTIEITQEHDFRSKDKMQRVMSPLRGLGDLLFFCSPCCGGSPCQRLNIHVAAKRGWQSTVVRLIGHWDMHLQLRWWAGFMPVAEH